MSQKSLRVAVIGVGQFGRNHCRVVSQSLNASLAGVLDIDASRASEAAAAHGCPIFEDLSQVAANADAAVVAVPTSAHAQVGCRLLENGMDVLLEKPMASDLEAADRLLRAAESSGRILQVGHLERFNPAVQALERRTTLPLFFEVHRMSVFSPRSLDVDVVLDLMIHDLDIVLALARTELREIRAAGISILSDKVDIANVRLEFVNGCIANLTASRISTERVRKLRLFQPQQYLSLDYGRQDVAVFTVGAGRQIGFEQLAITKGEPLQIQFESFLEAIDSRREPVTSARASRHTLEAALAILDKIKEHSALVSNTLVAGWKP